MILGSAESPSGHPRAVIMKLKAALRGMICLGVGEKRINISKYVFILFEKKNSARQKCINQILLCVKSLNLILSFMLMKLRENTTELS